jgi:hypothetical protein
MPQTVQDRMILENHRNRHEAFSGVPEHGGVMKLSENYTLEQILESYS